MSENADTTLAVYVDVTDTVATHWRAGIQRVVLQLLDQLRRDERLDVRPVVWLQSARSFRSLTADEQVSLDPLASVRPPTPDPGARPGGLTRLVGVVRPWLGRARRSVKTLLVATKAEPFLRRGFNAAMRVSRDRHLVPLAVTLPTGSVLFEMDTVWNNLWVDRAELYERLQTGGVRVAVLVHDLLPQEHPEWFEDSLVRVSDATIRAQVGAADLLLVTSHDGAERVTSWASGQGLDLVEPAVVTLGSDGAAQTAGRASAGGSRPPGGPSAQLPPELDGVRYVLSVGTIEPRKNHATLLEAFDSIWTDDPDAHLVLVGRPGWHSEDLIARIVEHPRAGGRLRWYRGVDDAQLDALYRSARVVAVASLAEGYGLPVVEALLHATPVVASDCGALVEAGAGLADHVAAEDVAAWAEALGLLLADDEASAQRRRAIADYRPPVWADTGRRVAGLLIERFAAVPAEDGSGHTP